MSHFQIISSIVLVCLLIGLSAFFSIAETGLMAINRYRLRHQARLKKSYAVLLLRLLKRPDRLLGMILIGNNIANIVASAITTYLALHFFGDVGVVVATTLLTLGVLVFAEVAPKTLAALYPEKVSKWVAWPIYVMLVIFYPLVMVINLIANGLLRLFGIKVGNRQIEVLTREELRSVVYDTAGKTSRQYHHMLLGILDLNKVSVNDVMIPRHEIEGIDFNEDEASLQKQLAACAHHWIPVYRETIDDILGILHIRELTAHLLAGQKINKDSFLRFLKEPYFVPEGTPLNTQLLNFQKERKRTALVVDEYGEIQGLISLEDILEEIVGEFSTEMGGTSKAKKQSDNSFLVNGSITIRELNKVTKWQLPTSGPRTLNGLIVEYLEMIPKENLGVKIYGHPIEVVQVKRNRVTLARIYPAVD